MGVERIRGVRGRSYSDAVVVTEPAAKGRWIYVSGQIAAGVTEGEEPGHLGRQARACLEQIDEILNTCGATLEDVVRMTAYLVSLENYEEYSGVRAEKFGDAFPASVAVEVSGLLGGALIEIDAIAFCE